MPTSKTRQKLILAIGRIEDDSPQNKELREKSLRGKLKLNLISVAKEAGVSRTLISGPNSSYPEIRDMISPPNRQLSRRDYENEIAALKRRVEVESERYQKSLSDRAHLIAELHRRDKYRKPRDPGRKKQKDGKVIPLR